jgi:predicted GNAT family N-acyltransferase
MDETERSPSEIRVRWARDTDDVAGALAVRELVFCGEQGVPRAEEIDGLDGDAEHIVAIDPARGQVVGTLRLLVDGGRAKVGRVAVQREWRRRGVASRMLALALSRCREEGCESVRLAAQMQATELYERAGFRVESAPFEEAGIPHVWMGLELGS